jgi:hypothetical protein
MNKKDLGEIGIKDVFSNEVLGMSLSSFAHSNSCSEVAVANISDKPEVQDVATAEVTAKQRYLDNNAGVVKRLVSTSFTKPWNNLQKN